MNRYTYYNSELDAFTKYHLENEAIDDHKHLEGPSDRSNAIIDGFSGAVGTGLATLAVYPIDLIVKRLQVQRQIRGTQGSVVPSGTNGDDESVRIWKTGEGGVVEKGKEIEGRVQERAQAARADVEELYVDFVDAAKRIYIEEGGVSAFYSGCLHDTANSMGTAFLYFLSYNYMRERRLQAQARGGDVAKTLGIFGELGVGVLAGCFAKFFTSPIANIVTRKQTAALRSKPAPGNDPNTQRLPSEPVAKRTDVPSVSVIMKDIYKEKGILGFWSGYKATLFLTLNPSITLFLYETFKTLLPRKFREQPTAGQTFLIAAIAKGVASSIMYPFSLAKARSQVQQGWKTGIIQMLRDIYRVDGLAGLYEGVQGEILKGFFQNGITMLIKESVHHRILSMYFLFKRARDRSPNQTITGTVANAAQEVYQKNTTDSQKSVVERVTSAAQEGVDAVTSTVVNTGSTVSNGAQNGYDAIKNTVSNTGSAVGNTAQSSYEAVKNTVSSTGSVVGNTAQSGYDSAKTSVTNTGSAVSSSVGTAKEKLSSGYIAASGTVSNTIDSVKNTASSLAGKVGEAAASGKSTIVDKTIESRKGLAKLIDVDTFATSANSYAPVKTTETGLNKEIGGVEWDATDKLQQDDISTKIGGIEWDDGKGAGDKFEKK